MKQQDLIRFIDRIVSSSPDETSAEEAVRQLAKLLDPQLTEDDREMLGQTLTGIDDSLDTMKNEQLTSPEAIALAAERARLRHIQDEENERNGRC